MAILNIKSDIGHINSGIGWSGMSEVIFWHILACRPQSS